MCLAIPGKILSIETGDAVFRAACVDFCGVRKTVSLAFTPEAEAGDFVLVHVGFAITRLDQEEAARTYQYLEQMGALEEIPADAPAWEPAVPARGPGGTP
jgi:hydrogenase expression/formation protein HypC